MSIIIEMLSDSARRADSMRSKADKRAVNAILEGEYEVALLAIGEAMSYKAIGEEQRFLLEVEEVNGD